MAKHVAIEGRHPRPSFIVDDDSSPPHTNINDFNPGHTSSPSYYDHHVFHHHLDLLYSQTKMRDNSANRSHVTEATHDVTECSDTEDCFAGLEVSAVNTHSSILNITEDHEDGEGEFDENEFNFLFPDDEPTDSYLNASLLIEDFTGDDRYHLDPESVYPKHKETDCTNEQTTYYEVTASFLEHNTPEPLFCTTPADSSLLDQITPIRRPKLLEESAKVESDFVQTWRQVTTLCYAGSKLA